MKYSTIKNAVLALLILAGASQLSANFYSFKDGSPIAGKILRIDGEDVTIVGESGKSSLGESLIRKRQTFIRNGTSSL